MFGIICAIISGIAMSIQGVFNTRLGEKIGVMGNYIISSDNCPCLKPYHFFIFR